MAKPVGRPTLMTSDTLNKLEEVFSIGGSDKEACFYADISHQTLYNYQQDHPEFVERKEALKERPILKARQEVVKGLNNNPEFSLKYLERKKKDEFSLKTETEHSGKVEFQKYERIFSKEVQEAVREIEEKLKLKLIEKHEPNEED